MGGYIFEEKGHLAYIDFHHDTELRPRAIQSLAQRDHEDDETQINDRSKRDLLAKSFVVLQTSWFIIQCIARHAKGLDITELELVTLAYAVLNGAMYICWWHKPLDVECPIVVTLGNAALDDQSPGSWIAQAQTSSDLEPHRWDVRDGLKKLRQTTSRWYSSVQDRSVVVKARTSSFVIAHGCSG